ncbi:MAG: hypothetical protein CMA63_02145 [Euryarchaeota archaeon]|nr:hypothetical protein [Euryarchaeota archaeon]
MKWKLAHFGLDLTAANDYLEASICQINKECVNLQDFEGIHDVPNSVLDVRLNGPNTEQTLLTCVGHIELAVPIARPECLDQIVEIVNQNDENQPLIPFDKKYRVNFSRLAEDGETVLVVDPNEVFRMLEAHREKIIIHGDEQTEHNVEGFAEEMMLKIMPIPSILVRNQPSLTENKLNIKLNKIIRLNNTLAEILATGDWGCVTMVARDIIDLLSYQVMTYLDNTIPGLPSDSDLEAGVAQYLGKHNPRLQGGSVEDMEVGGTSLQRIVRCINSGETVINVEGTSESLCFEMSKQIAFERVWAKSMRETQIIHINSLGEIQRMEIGTIKGFHWSHWNGDVNFERDEIVTPRFSNSVIQCPQDDVKLRDVLKKLRTIDVGFRLDVQTHFAASYLYTLISDSNTETIEQQIIVCDASIDPIVLSPVLRQLRENVSERPKICLIFTKMNVDNAATFHYTPTPDEYRNLIIALTELYERPEFEEIRSMFKKILPTDLQLVSTYLKGLSRRKIMRILGSVIVAKESLDTDYIREYIREILLKENKDVSHLLPNPRILRRRLTTEQIYEQGKIIPTFEEGVMALEDEEVPESTTNHSLYESLKGLDPLVHWAKSKQNLFTQEAKEYGFVRHPSGLLLTGVPGCGKTMAAKIIAEEWGMELVRVNPDDITSRFMGGNEENIRNLLNQLVEKSPSICFIDEAEKLFSQMRGGSEQTAGTLSIDSTESILLQFMEENEEPVFFIFTSNDINKMSPALVDRFDACFFVDLPDEVSRAEIIQLMLHERKKGKLDLNYNSLAAKSKDFTGRDIRGAIEEAMMGAFNEKRELTQKDLEKVFQEVSTTASTHESEIEKMRILVKEGKIRSANSLRIVRKPSARYDVSVG